MTDIVVMSTIITTPNFESQHHKLRNLTFKLTDWHVCVFASTPMDSLQSSVAYFYDVFDSIFMRLVAIGFSENDVPLLAFASLLF